MPREIKDQEKFGVAVIGGGPAGIMAAIKAAQSGARVLLLEKGDSLGKKLLMTGKGRCNVTQAEFDDRKFIERIGPNGKFLFSALSVFGPEETIKFFEDLGVSLKTERGGRVFPKSDQSRDILNALKKTLNKYEVEIRYDSQVVNFELKEGRIERAVLKHGYVYAENFILAVGGKSYPITGSSGDGYRLSANVGHEIVEPSPALVPVRTKEPWVKKAQGLSLKNARISVFQNGKKIDSKFGEMLFTHFGVSGPIILELSRQIGKLLKKGRVLLEIDLKPALDEKQLDKRLQKDFEDNANKDFENYLPQIIPKKLIEVILELSKINPKKKINSITKEERKIIADILKGLRLTAAGLLDFSCAIVTSGGVRLKEVDSKTMQSKIIPNLYFAGEVLDLDAPTGGYNLQISWTTGQAAGLAAARK